MITIRSQIVMAFAAAFIITRPVAAQEKADTTRLPQALEEIGQDTDPTKPVLFSLRDEFLMLKNNSSLNSFIFRFDRLILETLEVPGPVRGVITRFDIPVVTYSGSSTTETGLGNIYMQALVAPRIMGNFALAAGTGLVLPTETSPLLGLGKWIASPAIVPVWFFPRKGLAFIKFQDWFSFAGQANRPSVHYLTVTGQILRRISRTWWAALDTETNTNWLKDGNTWYKSGLLLGKMFSPRIGIWLKGEIPYGQYRLGDWIIKGSIFFTRF